MSPSRSWTWSRLFKDHAVWSLLYDIGSSERLTYCATQWQRWGHTKQTTAKTDNEKLDAVKQNAKKPAFSFLQKKTIFYSQLVSSFSFIRFKCLFCVFVVVLLTLKRMWMVLSNPSFILCNTLLLHSPNIIKLQKLHELFLVYLCSIYNHIHFLSSIKQRKPIELHVGLYLHQISFL